MLVGKTPCKHEEWSDGHCGEMDCSNYINKCPRHALISGEAGKKCKNAKTY